MTRRTLRLTALALAASLVAAAPGWADSSAEMNIQDDSLIMGDPGQAAATAARWKSMGVDSVRITAFWDRIETAPGVYNWSPPRFDLDQGVRMVRQYGMEPVITISQKGPTGTYKPDPARFGRFAGALAARYAGSVYKYTIGNEPNQSTFLTPQGSGGKAFSPHWYRRLVQAAYPAIKRADRSSLVIIGVMAPIGRTSGFATSVAPMIFLREFACRDTQFRPVRTGNCAGFTPARGDAWSQHPYTIRYRLRPFSKMPSQLVGTADLPAYFTLLDGLTRRGAILAPGGRFNLYITEYGFESNPTDRKFGFTQALQSQYLQEGAYIAWRTPRVKMFNQYLYRDDPDFYSGGSNVTFQTGLAFRSGAEKQSARSFPHPFFVDTISSGYSRTRARFWGQVRPGGATTVSIQHSPSCSTYTNVTTVTTNFRGYFWRIGPVRTGCYRFSYAGGTKFSEPRRF